MILWDKLSLGVFRTAIIHTSKVWCRHSEAVFTRPELCLGVLINFIIEYGQIASVKNFIK